MHNKNCQKKRATSDRKEKKTKPKRSSTRRIGDSPGVLPPAQTSPIPSPASVPSGISPPLIPVSPESKVVIPSPLPAATVRKIVPSPLPASTESKSAPSLVSLSVPVPPPPDVGDNAPWPRAAIPHEQDVPALPSLESIATHHHLWRDLPVDYWPRFRELCRPHLQAYQRASRDDDANRRLEALVRFLELPKICLMHSRGGERGLRQLSEQLKPHMARLRGEEVAVNLDPLDGASEREDLVTKDPMLPRVLRVKTLVEKKHLSRATKTLLQGNLAPMNASTAQSLRDLHPRQSAAVPPLPELSPRIVVDPEVIAELVNSRIATGAAPAYSGWTGELLQCLVGDSDCLNGLSAIVEDQLNGTLDDVSRDYILGSSLIAGAKPAGGVRPIAMGEPLYKLAGQYALHLIRPEIPSLLEPIQMALSPGGPEKAAHVIQAAIESASPHSVVVKTDFRNAFNSIHRRVILDELFRVPTLSLVWRFVHWAYKAPSRLLMMKKGRVFDQITSAEGVKQGDVLGACLFAIAVRPLYNEVREKHQSVHAIAILDDLELEGPADEVMKALAYLKPQAAKRGLELVPQKCKALWHDPTSPPPNLLELVRRSGVSLVTGAMESVGVMLGRDDGAISRWAMSSAKTHDRLFSSLLHPALPVQHSMAILRFCGIPRMNYLTRVIRPDLLKPACTYFDRKVIETAQTKLGLPTPLSHVAFTLLTQPIRLGGFGIRRMASVSPVAFWSSTAQAGPEIAQLIISRLARHNSEAPPRNSLTLTSDTFFQAALQLSTTRALYSCHASMIAAAVKPTDDLLPLAGRDFWHWYGESAACAGLQRLLVAEIENARADRLLKEAEGDPRQIALLVSIRAKLAGAWLTTLPSSPELILTNSHFRVASRLRLGLPPQDDLPRRCLCDDILTQDPHHFLSCIMLKPSTTFRHDHIVRVLSLLIRKAGGACYVEPRFYDRTRPDIHVIFPSLKLLIDVSVVHPAAPTYAQNSHVPLFSAASRERDKATKFKTLALAEEARFIPFVLETFGAWGRQAIKLITDLTSLLSEHKGLAFSSPDARGEMVRILAVALQSGNARVLLNGCMRSREHAARPIPQQQRGIVGSVV